MKQFFTFFLFLLALNVSTSYSQESYLYAAKYYSDEIDIVDTTGLAFTVLSTMTATSDFGAVNGMYGIAMHPITEVMYVCYQSSGGGSARRLGTINLETAEITDIGSCGNIIDMDFGPDGTLYGSTGNFAPDFSFVIIDIVTAAQIFIFDYTPSSYGGGMAYNPFSDEMYYQNNAGTSLIDLGTYIETVGSPVGSPGETQAMVILTPTLGWMAFFGTLYTFNPITEIFTSSISIDSYHAFGFGPPSCTPMTLELTGTTVCEGNEVTLDATGMGDIITWTGGIFDDVPFMPGPPGTYIYTATSDDEDDCPLPVEVVVLPLPTVIAGAGDENYCEGESIVLSAAGDADEYSWDPLDFTPGVGTHTYTLIGAYDIGCINSSTVDITVHPLPTITASVDDDVICIGSEVVFTGGGGETYIWETPGVEDGESYEPTETGTMSYTVFGTDINDCENSASVEVEVLEQIEITGVTTDEIEGEDGAIDISFTGGAPAYTVDWDNDETDDFDDPADIAGLAGGTYTVIVKGAEGCEGTAIFTVNSQLSVSESNLANLSVYPNPTTANLNIEWEGQFDYELISVNGAVVLTGSALDNETISLESFAGGVYFLQLQSAITSSSVKVVKK